MIGFNDSRRTGTPAVLSGIRAGWLIFFLVLGLLPGTLHAAITHFQEFPGPGSSATAFWPIMAPRPLPIHSGMGSERWTTTNHVFRSDSHRLSRFRSPPAPEPPALPATPAGQAAFRPVPTTLAAFGGPHLYSVATVVALVLVLSAVLLHFLRKRKTARQGSTTRPPALNTQPQAHLKDPGGVLSRTADVVEITKPKTTIGRDPRNDIVIKKPTISSLHATIEYRNLAFYLEDQRSTNGTRLNNRKLQANMPMRLKNGDRIQLAAFAFIFTIPARIPFSDTVMLGMTPLEGPEPGSTIVLDLDSADGQQGLIGCMQNHLLQLYSLGAKYREFAGLHFSFELQSAVAEKAHECLTRTQADGLQHCASFAAHKALYLVCSLPVAINRAPEWYGSQYGGFTRFILQWLQTEPFRSGQSDTLCVITFGQDPSTWVSLTIVPTHQAPDAVEIMSVDFLNATEKATLDLDFDRYGRVV